MKTAVVIAALSLLVATSEVQAEGLKVGHLDLQRVLAQSEAGKAARERYQAQARKYQEEIDARTERLKQLKTEIESVAVKVKAGETTPATVSEKDKEYGLQVRELQRLLGGYQEELKVFDAELGRQVLEQLSPILTEFARRHSYDYILRGFEPLAFANEKLDVTDQVIKEFNARRAK